jgi:hypothetical protein
MQSNESRIGRLAPILVKFVGGSRQAAGFWRRPKGLAGASIPAHGSRRSTHEALRRVTEGLVS